MQTLHIQRVADGNDGEMPSPSQHRSSVSRCTRKCALRNDHDPVKDLERHKHIDHLFHDALGTALRRKPHDPRTDFLHDLPHGITACIAATRWSKFHTSLHQNALRCGWRLVKPQPKPSNHAPLHHVARPSSPSSPYSTVPPVRSS